MTNRGIDLVLDHAFGSGSSLGPFYLGLISAENYSGIDRTTDTMSSHTGWEEFTDYDETSRVEWVPGTVSSQSVNNPDLATFTANAAGAVVGYFVTDSPTKSGVVGELYDLVIFDTAHTTYVGESFTVRHTLSGRDITP